ncbi:integrase, catalytic region, zinc finger, CCHC-type containing protein [Tanacetum coccineum]
MKYSQLRHGLGYQYPFTQPKQFHNVPKLYLALFLTLGNSEISLHVRDIKDTLDEASKSQQKVYEKMNDPIAVANKQNYWIIDYTQINYLYKDFVPQKELSTEQQYFPSSFIPSDKNSNATPSIPRDIKEMKDVFESTESALCEQEKQNDFLKDQLLEVSLKHEVELSVLLNHECVDNSLHAEIEQLKKKSIKIQEGLQAKIKSLEKDVQSTPLLPFRCYLILGVLQSELRTRLETVKNDKSVNTKFDMTNVSPNILCVTPINKQVFQKKKVVSKTEEKHVVLKPVTLQTSPDKSRGAHSYKNVTAPGMYKVVTKQASQTNEAKSGLFPTGLNVASSVRRPMDRDSHDKKSVLANSKISAKKVEVYFRKNKQTDNTSANAISNKENVIDVDVANASRAKNLLCVSCMQNVLIPCHDKCLAKYKLNVRRALSTNSRTPKSSDTTHVVFKTRFSENLPQSKPLDTTLVVLKPKIDVGSVSKAKNKASSASKIKKRNLRDTSLSTYMKNKIQTSRVWQKWFESQPNVVWSPVVQIVLWIVDSGCSKHMTGDRSLLRNFIEKFMGTVRFRNDNFTAITGYGDYIQGNITICHVYYVEGLGHNLFSVGQFCDGDLEVAFLSKTCYVRNLEGDDLLTAGCESNFYTISISDMTASSPVCLMSKATSTKSWLWHHRLSHLNFGTINDLTRLDLVDGLPKFKYGKDHLCSACEKGKSKKASHPPKLVLSDHSKLELLHMDLCGPMRVASINGKKYILVIMDDYSRYTWVYFLRSKDETPKIIKKFCNTLKSEYAAEC